MLILKMRKDKDVFTRQREVKEMKKKSPILSTARNVYVTIISSRLNYSNYQVWGGNWIVLIPCN